MRYLVIAGLFIFALWTPEKAPAVSTEPKEILEVKVKHVGIDPASLQPVVLLVDAPEERGLLIWIGQCEATAMAAELEGTRPLRPSTHDLAERILQKTNGRVQRIIITHSKDGIYYATLILEKDRASLEIDARPSDSIVLALKFKAPIFVSKRLFEEMAIPLKERRGADERYGLTTQELTRELAQSFSYGSTRGVLIADVRQGSQAEKDGLQRGDILVQAGEKAVENVKSLQEALAESKGPLKAKVFRKGNFRTLTINPLEQPKEPLPAKKK